MRGIPSGFRSISGETAASIERGRNIFLNIFGSFGYKVLIPSTLQLFGSCWERLSESVRARMISLGSPSGETCCLRPDMTIAALEHMSTSHAPEERPLRVCYADRVFRNPSPPDIDVETFQLGAELLGGEGDGALVEMLTLLLQTLDAIGARESFLVIGDVSILEALLRDIAPTSASAMRNALASQSFSSYREILTRSPVPESLLSPLVALPSLRGGIDSLERASAILPSCCPLKEISGLFEALIYAGYGQRVFIDLSLARELDYYSGQVFEIFSGKHGKPVGGGGRYDRLLSSFGVIGQAAGFSFNLDQMTEKNTSNAIDGDRVMAWSGPLDPGEAMLRATDLAERGVRLEMSWVSQRTRSLDLARYRGYSWWTDLSDDFIYNLADNSRSRISSFLSAGGRND